MSKYYRLQAELNDDAGIIRPLENEHQTLFGGRPLEECELVLPWPFALEAGEWGLRMSDLYPARKLMSQRLLETIKGAGVDNLQLFPAQIQNTRTGDTISDYKVVNVLGLVSCANTPKSESSPLAGFKFFTKLVIDPSRTGGLLLFRLAESLMDIIVEERVAKAIDKGGFTDVVLEPLEDSRS